ncbi:MAG TPA: 1-deoxy-D-xylulose-5-phosphate reductoisomerase [Steroidobacteraceae bacterium]|nr:1-deoxy-D-xylulose-5-phosphate reductoisomerase [Steroidobacteraceae bacterium]
MSTDSSLINVAIFGATGSIGQNTLDVIARHPDRFAVFALAAQRNVAVLKSQCLQFKPRYAAMADADAAKQLRAELREANCPTEVLAGAAALDELAAHPDVHSIMAAIVGAAGLSSTLAAARAGKRILLANKESLVMSGRLFTQAVRSGNACLLPIDSEHNAIFQCLPDSRLNDSKVSAQSLHTSIKRLLLTASGGPFLRTAVEAMQNITPEQACAHPRWIMGKKISVDSATLMNKGLELIEASLLFDILPSRIDVLIHPQSIVHSLVEYVDGSMLAQLGNPDMRTPIAFALGWPARIASGVESLDLVQLSKLEFEAPDEVRFPCLRLARQAVESGDSAPAVLNAANEVAVAAFLAGELRFTHIAEVIDAVLQAHSVQSLDSLDAVMQMDLWAREHATQVTQRKKLSV